MSPTPAKPRPSKRILDSYTIKGSDGVIHPGDAVLMKAPDSSKRPYVARVEEIQAAGPRGSKVKVKVRWYYRPEESMGGRRPFHGSKEVFLSDHQDVQSADTIECKCNVYTFKEYTKLDAVNAEDYFCRFEYKSLTGSFVPDRIAVFCKCEMPYNPDDLMIQCDECSDCPSKKQRNLRIFPVEVVLLKMKRRLKVPMNLQANQKKSRWSRNEGGGEGALDEISNLFMLVMSWMYSAASSLMCTAFFKTCNSVSSSECLA